MLVQHQAPHGPPDWTASNPEGRHAQPCMSQPLKPCGPAQLIQTPRSSVDSTSILRIRLLSGAGPSLRYLHSRQAYSGYS